MSSIYTKQSLSELASEVASDLAGGENIYLSGDLGAGKTTFAQLLIAALNNREKVTSPTFQIMNEYDLDNGKLVHIDLYRIDNPDDIAPLGIQDFLQSDNTICLVEWPERGETTLPKPHYHLHFEHRSPDTREVSINK